MRMRTGTRKSFRAIPKVGPTMKSSSKFAKSTGSTLRKEVAKLPQVQKFRESLASEPIETIAKLAQEASKQKKRVEGATGLNLMPVGARKAAISGTASNDFTTSTSMYMFRPPRKRVDDAVRYAMKRSVTNTQIGAVNENNVYDINILDAKPVKNNPDTSSDYTPMSVKRAFDNMLLGNTTESADSTATVAKVAQSDLHVKSLSVDLTLSNLYATGVLIDVYELVPQFDLGPTEYSTENYSAGYMSPYWCCIKGIQGAKVIQTDDTLETLDLAFVPSNSTYFNRCWKTVKHLRLNMSANSVHRHKSVYEINKTVTWQQMDQVSGDGGKFAGWNPTFLIVQRGIPVAGEQAAANSIRYSCNIQLNYEATPDKQAKVIVYDENT